MLVRNTCLGCDVLLVHALFDVTMGFSIRRAVGAAVAVVGLGVYRVYSARRNSSS